MLLLARHIIAGKIRYEIAGKRVPTPHTSVNENDTLTMETARGSCRRGLRSETFLIRREENVDAE